MKRSLKVYNSNMANKYWCEIISKASVKSSERMQRGVAVTSACAMASSTVVTASKMELPGTP